MWTLCALIQMAEKTRGAQMQPILWNPRSRVCPSGGPMGQCPVKYAYPNDALLAHARPVRRLSSAQGPPDESGMPAHPCAGHAWYVSAGPVGHVPT